MAYNLRLPNKLESVLFVGAVTVALSVSLLLLYARNSRPSTASTSEPIHAVASSSETTKNTEQVNLVAGLVKFLTQTQDIPLQPAITPTPTYIPLPALYTELSSKGLIANISNTELTLVWSTAAPQPTRFTYGATANLVTRKLSDDRGSNTTGFFHFVTLKNLTPQATYYFTGPSPITDSFTLPPSLPDTTTKTIISGTVSGVQGECLVKATVLRGSLASTNVVTPVNNAAWQLDLQKVRDSGLSDYMNPLPTDTVRTEALCFGAGNKIYTGMQESTLQQALAQPSFLVVKAQK